ncbi:GNAT family N-acetyltransferase [Micromonospora sp. NPDC093277]|uniref:GNAT family N-acetyltransferase n=1 Tax=Micromonospora sp. NPDC093277 TaxID=3364291 RepID=UPI0037F2D43A
MNDLRIRDRTAADLPHCVAILAAVHRLDHYPLNWPDDPQPWLSPANALHAWVAETARGHIVGHVAVHRVDSATAPASMPTAEVSRLFVTPDARGCHVGSQLLTHAREWAVGRRLQLVLEVVDHQCSGPAITLYERAGWRHTDTTAATWTGPEGVPVRLRRYTLTEDAPPT